MKFLLTCGAKPLKKKKPIMAKQQQQQQQQPYATPMVRKNEERGRRRCVERGSPWSVSLGGPQQFRTAVYFYTELSLPKLLLSSFFVNDDATHMFQLQQITHDSDFR